MKNPPCTKETSQCKFLEWTDTNNRPDCCTKHLKEMLFAIADILEQLRIKYWIDFGTLLGAVRNAQFIPWDDDVDISFCIEDASAVDHLLNLLEEQIRNIGYHVIRTSAISGGGLKVRLSKINQLHLDLYLHHNKDGIWESSCGGDFADWKCPASYLDNMVDVSLYGRNFPAPSPVHEFLCDYRYGPTYLIPVQFDEFGAYFETSEFTPWVAECLVELDKLGKAVRLAETNLSSIPDHPTNIAASIRLPRFKWIKTRLNALWYKQERIAFWVRMSFNMSKSQRLRLNRPLWAYLNYTNYLRRFADQYDLQEIPLEEITPTTYLLLNRLARKKARLAYLETLT